MSAPAYAQSPSPTQAPFFIITRHQKTVQLLQKLGGRMVNSINEIPSGALVLGVLPIDMIAELSKGGSRFISVSIDPAKFTSKFGVKYNPKEADSMLGSLSDDEFVSLLRFLLYERVSVEEVSVDDVKNEAKAHSAIYYVGSPQFSEALQKLFGLPVTNKYSANTIAFSPVDVAPYYYMLKVTDRNLVINSYEEFKNALNAGKIRIYRVNAKVRELTWQDVLGLINAQANAIQENVPIRTATKEL